MDLQDVRKSVTNKWQTSWNWFGFLWAETMRENGQDEWKIFTLLWFGPRVREWFQLSKVKVGLAQLYISEHLRKCWGWVTCLLHGLIQTKFLREFWKQAQVVSQRCPEWVISASSLGPRVTCWEGESDDDVNVVPSKARMFQHFYQAEVYLCVFVKDN